MSTRAGAPAVGFREALLAGLAPDGGLYVPERLPRLDASVWAGLSGAPLGDAAAAVLQPLVSGEMPRPDLHRLLEQALDFPVPVVRLDDNLAVVELFHGPTCAFKDVGARVLARLMSFFHDDRQPPLTVLVATSGDTGGAVAHAFHGVPRTRVVVLYPEGQVSPVQEAQFTTLGENVTAVAVSGTFDDCQRLAREAFADPGLRSQVNLTSANSISLGRLLPQMAYYAHAVAQAEAGTAGLVSVPSGNFGNLAAGLMARQMGLPVDRFVAATTINDTVPRYLSTGVFEPRPSVRTLANAMDVGNPSNLERIRWLFGDDLVRIRASVTASVHTDGDVRVAIRDLDDRYGYLADPHTAIAYLGARATSAAGTPALFLATAHPAKFFDVVEPIVGRPVPVPAALAEALARPRQAARIGADLAELRPWLET